MSIPEKCTVLVIGGGPAGSYAASVLAREGIDTVVLEADKFPRYHIGESTLPSLRHFFQFIDFYETFNSHGFFHKASIPEHPQLVFRVLTMLLHQNGAVFRLAQGQPDAYTDFLDAGGPEGYAWNLIRSESDDLLFRHAGKCGAHIFEETKVDTIQFLPDTSKEGKENGIGSTETSVNPGKPVSATWIRKDGTSGSINYQYLIDASGRRGILSTKYLKNRKFNDNFKNVANWAYWKSDNLYGPGTHMHGSPYFEALDDASGWAWFMPLHDGTRSVGVVQHQKMATDKKRELGSPSTLDFYKKSLEMAPTTKSLLTDAELVTDVHSASDWSYTASRYHLTNARICGDAGSFIDPLFSSGVHLAIVGGLSAAVTIAASLRGGYDEQAAGSWHSKKTVESYTRFFLAVSSATKQIRKQHEPIIQEADEEGFQRAFDLLRPIIQGTVDADTTGKLSQKEVSKVLEFCYKAFVYVPPEKKDALFAKLKSLGVDSSTGPVRDDAAFEAVQGHLNPEEIQILEILRSRRMIREDPFEMDSFSLDTIDGVAPNLVRGQLGLVAAKKAEIDRSHFYSTKFLNGAAPGIREGSLHLLSSKIVGQSG